MRAQDESTGAGTGPGVTAAKGRVGGSVIQTIASLAIVVGIIGLLAMVVRKLAKRSGGLMGAIGPGGRSPSGLLEVLGRYPVAAGTTLILLKLDRRVLLVSQSGGRGLRGGASLTTLTEIIDPEDVASILIKARDQEGESLSHRFQEVLSGADRLTAEVLEKQPVTLAPTVTRAKAQGGGGGAVGAIRSRLASMREGFSIAGDQPGRVA